ncbi:MAG: hypothetical protein KME42_04090 [Tildeniella nuda ZEHNDER 1965/U140]|jgi:hypothetical protein|nr:hypothetical protein [Tildeniella nuda ZEHNDER 1965/U140]
MGTRLSSIALVTLAATLLSSIAQASPSGGAIEPKLGAMVCINGHYNSDGGTFICTATTPKTDSMVCFDGYPNAEGTAVICNQFIESRQWLENEIRRDSNRRSRRSRTPPPPARKALFTLISYENLYDGLYNYVVVDADGWVSKGRVETSARWGACRGCGSGRINTEQLVQFEQRINQLTLTPQAKRPKKMNGKRHTVILIQQHGVIERRDYVDGLPPDLHRFVEETTFLVQEAKDKALDELFRRATPRK